jgi:DNA gyrase subunit A
VAAPNGRGKALINILPLEQGERITTIMPLPEDESSWGNLDVMFATTGGTVRRNKLSDFVDVRRSGIIAMKLEEGEAIVDVQICTERDDVLLTAAGGQCIRFPVTDVRVFTGRTSMGVRGIALAENASAPRPTNTAPPAAAAKASSRCRSTTATASWWPRSRSRTQTRSCW